MNKKLIKKVILELWYFMLAYVTDYLFPRVKESFIEAKDKFLESLWEKIKEDVTEHLKNAVETVKIYYGSKPYEEKEKMVLDTIFSKINLNFALKFIAKKFLKKKIRNLIEKSLKNLDVII